jgi:hypothetical protein
MRFNFTQPKADLDTPNVNLLERLKKLHINFNVKIFPPVNPNYSAAKSKVKVRGAFSGPRRSVN